MVVGTLGVVVFDRVVVVASAVGENKTIIIICHDLRINAQFEVSEYKLVYFIIYY